MTFNVNIKLRDREVQNPVLRTALGFAMAIIWLVTMSFGFVSILYWLIVAAILLALSPVFAVLHLVLRASGRKGFMTRSPDKFSIEVSIDGFRKA